MLARETWVDGESFFGPRVDGAAETWLTVAVMLLVPATTEPYCLSLVIHIARQVGWRFVVRGGQTLFP